VVVAQNPSRYDDCVASAPFAGVLTRRFDNVSANSLGCSTPHSHNDHQEQHAIHNKESFAES
jgi:hypothetical protein